MFVVAKVRIYVTANAQKNRKISTKAITFLNDQRSYRKMFIGSIDSVESKSLNNKRSGKMQKQLQQQNDYTQWRY